jgi:hypothetical protein
MRFGTWNVRSMYGAGSLTAVAEEISKYMLDLVGVQEVRWDGGEYTFFYGKGNENLANDENGDLLADSHNILNRWKKSSQLLKINMISDVRQVEIHTAEPLVPDRSSFEVVLAIAKLKTYKSTGSDQIPAE